MGRKTKLTDKCKNDILQVIAVGGSKTLACKHAGISLVTLMNWLHRGKQATKGIYRDFYLQYEQAEARPDILAMGIVHRAVKDGDLSAARWWLEKKAGWGQPTEPQVQISISPDQMSITQLLAEAESASKNLRTLAPPIIDLDEE
jgi:hypothetical protein